MRTLKIYLLLLLVPYSSAWAQKEQAPDKPADGATQNRPTLGPTPAPSLYGPHSSTTTNPQRLIRLKNIYVERIDNELSDKLMEGLAKSGRFKIVAEAKEADAILRGTCFNSHRLKSLHSEIFLSDRASGDSIWQDSIHRPFNPPALVKSVDDTAALIVEHLSDSVQAAQRK